MYVFWLFLFISSGQFLDKWCFAQRSNLHYVFDDRRTVFFKDIVLEYEQIVENSWATQGEHLPYIVKLQPSSLSKSLQSSFTIIVSTSQSQVSHRNGWTKSWSCISVVLWLLRSASGQTWHLHSGFHEEESNYVVLVFCETHYIWLCASRKGNWLSSHLALADEFFCARYMTTQVTLGGLQSNAKSPPMFWVLFDVPYLWTVCV